MNDLEKISRMLALYDQIENPGHVHLRMGSVLLSHHPDPRDPNDLHLLDRSAIRFTRLAAEAMMSENPELKMEEAK